MIPQPNQWNVVFAHPAFPKRVEPPADWHPLRESVFLGPALDLLPTARARVCLDVTPDHTPRSSFHRTSPWNQNIQL